jgi:excisionase family DNA binding protein
VCLSGWLQPHGDVKLGCLPQRRRRERGTVVDVQTKDVLNAEEAAEFLGFNPYTIREKARLGEIPGRKIGREWRFSRRQLLEWVEGGNGQQSSA